MIAIIKKQFWLQRDMLAFGIALEAAGVVFGSILFYCIGRSENDQASYLPLGTIIGMILFVIYFLLGMMSAMQLNFQTEVAMGCTRKRFFVSYYIMTFVQGVICVLALALMNLAENAVCRGLYSGTKPELFAVGDLLRYGVPALLLVVAVGGLCGALLMRYGKVAGWTLYAVWMIVFIGWPRISDAATEAPGSVYGRIGRAVLDAWHAVPFNGWILLGVVVTVVSLVWSYALVRKQQVL